MTGRLACWPINKQTLGQCSWIDPGTSPPLGTLSDVRHAHCHAHCVRHTHRAPTPTVPYPSSWPEDKEEAYVGGLNFLWESNIMA